jgi:uncharacterized glyoxalase superfamily protein PhnB
MRSNRSIPRCTVIPELAYADVGKAADWLCDAFGFTLRVRIGNHRAQINVGDGAIVLTELHGDESARAVDFQHSVMVRVDDVDGHHERARQRGAQILRPPTSFPYGERQYNVQDIGGHRWTFSQSVADVLPEDWGGTSGQL